MSTNSNRRARVTLPMGNSTSCRLSTIRSGCTGEIDCSNTTVYGGTSPRTATVILVVTPSRSKAKSVFLLELGFSWATNASLPSTIPNIRLGLFPPHHAGGYISICSTAGSPETSSAAEWGSGCATIAALAPNKQQSAKHSFMWSNETEISHGRVSWQTR